MDLYHSNFIIGNSSPVDLVFTNLQKAQDFCEKRVEYLNNTPLSYYINIAEMKEDEEGLFKVKKILSSWAKDKNNKIHKY